MAPQGKSIISKGKTVKEAVKLALNLLNETIDQVEIEIIENESKGILGLGARPAVVRVTAGKADFRETDPEQEVRNLTLPEQASIAALLQSKQLVKPPEPEDLSGKVWVTNGRIHCKDAPDKYPLLSPGKDVRLYKNNELAEKTVIIKQSDDLRVELEEDVQAPEWELQISPDKMEASLKIVPGFRMERKLKDKAPDSYIQLEIVEKKTVVTDIDTRQVTEKLREIGVVYGVDYTEVAKACACVHPGTFVIARGTPPTPGTHGHFVPLKEVEIKKGLKERTDGTVDYREFQEFPSVERGQVLGMIEPPVPGTPGTTVTGEVVVPPEVFPLVLNEGIGVLVLEDGSRVIATEAGQPEIKLKGRTARISVVPKLLIGKDIDLEVGNIRYVGDVEVLGSVQEGMLVEAMGNVWVHQNVHSAKISSGGSVVVKNNIIGSEITSGKSTLLLAELHEILGALIPQLRQMEAAIKQLQTVSAFKVSSFSRSGLGSLIKILCDGKFKSFPVIMTSFIQKIDSGADILDADWLQLREQLHKGFVMMNASNLASVEDFSRLTDTVEQHYILSRDSDDESDCFIKAGYVHNSELYCSGDISISTRGTYHSKVRAAGSIDVEGVVRGGEIHASKGVRIGEAGTRGGVGTKIVVPDRETIQIEMAMEGTIIQVGKRMHKFSVQTPNVTARLGDDGLLIIG
ncbi:DUF342 domain-containing protein [Cohnella pontilimi]|uniref:DUF342 domain-containing protein n=1 Tax=Cohnella pontilimi TaxID=2564100 RepID=A0A4U0FDN2_9BACL|nr:FapA family protein [Cohnella pontilimi]TJY42848.1 DUF342 domain-containing protein [Cohnella pontilimi]